jgi:predicted ArsR family transcriptional regulator
MLRDGPATATQIAERLGIAKGSSHYHVRVLADLESLAAAAPA